MQNDEIHVILEYMYGKLLLKKIEKISLFLCKKISSQGNVPRTHKKRSIRENAFQSAMF